MGQVVRYARMTGWLAFHAFDSRRSAPGFPDLVLTHKQKKRTIFAELKTGNNKPTPAQRLWLDALSATPNQEVHLWRPTDLDSIIDTLK